MTFKSNQPLLGKHVLLNISHRCCVQCKHLICWVWYSVCSWCSWENAKQLFLSRGFMNELVNFDKENVSNAKLRQIRQYIRNPGFDDGIIGWASHAFIGVCIWLKALIRYTEVNNKSKPLKERLYKLEQKMKKVSH